jgi:hypothetical protein
MKTENIVKFLQTAYTDEKLAALLAHAQDGKLAYRSCCCLIGFPSANHSALGETLIPMCPTRNHFPHSEYQSSGSLHEKASDEYGALAKNDAERRELLRTLPDLPLSEQLRLEEEAAAEEGAAIEASGYPDPAENVRFA